MEKLYKRKFWKNAPDKTTPIDAESLDNIEKGIDDIDNALVSYGIYVENGVIYQKGE